MNANIGTPDRGPRMALWPVMFHLFDKSGLLTLAKQGV